MSEFAPSRQRKVPVQPGLEVCKVVYLIDSWFGRGETLIAFPIVTLCAAASAVIASFIRR